MADELDAKVRKDAALALVSVGASVATAGVSDAIRPLLRLVLGASNDERLLAAFEAGNAAAAARETEELVTALQRASEREAKTRREVAVEELHRLVLTKKIAAENIDDPRLLDAMLDALRAAMRSVSPGAVRPLLRLAVWYSATPRDRFFRGLVRVLSDADDDALAALRFVASKAREALALGELEMFRVVPKTAGRDSQVFWRNLGAPTGIGNAFEAPVDTTWWLANALRYNHLESTRTSSDEVRLDVDFLPTLIATMLE